jgi:two-component sensor histidine kinase
MITDAATRTPEGREALLRELDHRVRNNLSVLLSMVMFQMRRPPESALAALSRIAGQIMALSTVYDMTRGKSEGDYESAAKLCSSFIAKMNRELCPLCEIEFTSDGAAAEIPVEIARTLSIALGDLLLDSSERTARAGLPPRIKVLLAYEGDCRFSIKISDPAPREDDRLMAPALARALGGEFRATGGPDFTERELTFSSADSEGACRDLEP